MLVGLLLAVASAFATSAAFLFKQRGAVAAPGVDGRHPVRSAVGLFRSKWWTVGWLVALGAWLLHVGALSLAPLSIVQAVLSGGLVFLAVLAERFFGFHLGRRQWIGLTITAAGLVVVGITSHEPHGGRSSLAALICVEGGVLVAGALLVLGSVKLDNTHRNEGIMLAVAAGALFGVSDVAVKYLTRAANGGVLALVNPWLAAALLAMVIAFYASARSLQLGPGLEVIALTSVAANVVAISGGILIFHDPIGHGPTQIVGRLVAFCLVIVGAGLMPAPTRTETERRTPKRRDHAADGPASDPGPSHQEPSPVVGWRNPADATVSAASVSGLGSGGPA